MISQGKTCNVFLTKMDALLPETNCRNSLSELSLYTEEAGFSHEAAFDFIPEDVGVHARTRYIFFLFISLTNP